MIAGELRKIKRARELAIADFVKNMLIHEMAVIQKYVFTDIIDLAYKRSIKSNKSVGDEVYPIVRSIFSLVHKNYGFILNMRETNSGELPDSGGPSDIVAKILRNQDIGYKYHKVVDHFSKYEDMEIDIRNPDTKKTTQQISRYERARKQFDDIISLSCSRSAQMYSREQEGFYPDTLVLQGGGQKGVGYAGVIKALEETNRLSGIKHVAGTSAGALMGLPVALGFSATEIEDIVKQGRFAQFFSQSTKITRIFAGASLKVNRLLNTLDPSKKPYLEGFNLIEFSKKFMVPALAAAINISEKELRDLSDRELYSKLTESKIDLDGIYKNAKDDFNSMLSTKKRSVEVGILQFSGLPGRPESLQAAITSVRSVRSSRHSEKDLIESFIGDIIETSVYRYAKKNPETKMGKKLLAKESFRDITFTDLEELAIETDHLKFKEFGVAITRSHIFKLTWFARAFEKTTSGLMSFLGYEKADNGRDPIDKHVNFQPYFVRAGDKYIDMPIKKAVRISMNLPVLFGSIKHDGGSYYDGGINNNYPYRIFLDKYGEDINLAERSSIGFILSTIESDMENVTIEKLVNIAIKLVEVQLEKHPNTFSEKIKNTGNDLTYSIQDFVKNIKEKEFKEAVDKGIGLFTYPFKKSLGFIVSRMMSRNNASVPSAQILANTGVINTGSVGTADFHLDQEGKEALAQEGWMTGLRLLGHSSDGELMYSKARLISIIKAENELKRKYGKTDTISIPDSSMLDPSSLMNVLKILTNSDLNPLEVMSGVLGNIEPGKRNHKKIGEDKSGGMNCG